MTKAGPHVKKCRAHSKRTGAPCNNPPLAGMQVCRMHGGATKASKNAARERLEAAADRMARELLKMATDPNVADSVKLSAIRDSLDRAGLAAPKAVDVNVTATPFDELFDAVVTGGSLADYRHSVGDERPVPQSPAIEPQSRTGAPRVLASHPDGSAFIIDGDTDDAEDQADNDQDGRSPLPGHRVPDDGTKSGRDSLKNELPSPGGPAGYLPEDIALERAASANRNHRAQLRRR